MNIKKYIKIKRKIIFIKNNKKPKGLAEKIPNSFGFYIDDVIIVSFTSWKKRIHLCLNTFKQMLKQTMLPDKIILNLSIEEFPNKESELPQDLVEFV
jgi:hypothetical protein